MPQITKISPQRKKGFFNIFVDGKFSFGLDSETLVKEGLFEGKALSQPDVNRLKESSLFSKLLSSALAFLSYRPRSRKEMERSLDQKIRRILGPEEQNLGLEMKDKVISKIVSWGYLDDEKFANWFIEQRTKGRRPRGPSLIKRELILKGVDRRLVDDLISGFGENVGEEVFLPLLHKKMRTLEGKPIYEQKRKLMEFLLRRGFDYDLAREAVAKYFKKT